MARVRAVALFLVVVSAVATAGAVASLVESPGSGGTSLHGNHVEVDSQVSADGTVTVESAYLLTRGFVVLHEPTGNDEPGEAIGHSDLLDATDPTLGLRVGMDPAVWSDWSGDRAVWVVLHRDDGDGTFEPGADQRLTSFGVLAGEKVTLARGDGEASVAAQGLGITTPANGSLAVPRVALPTDGYLVVRGATAPTNGSVAAVVGLRRGVHTDLTVDLDRSFLARQRQRFDLRLQLYADDGDRRFDDGDRPIRAGEAPVATTLFARRPAGIPTVTATPTRTRTSTATATATTTATGTTTGGSPTATVTGSPTDATTSGDSRGTADGADAPSASPTPTATATPVATIPGGTRTGSTPTATATTGGTGPGLGIVAAVLAVFVVAIGLSRRS